MTRCRRAWEWGLFDALRHCLCLRNSGREKKPIRKSQWRIWFCNKKRTFIWFLIYGDFSKTFFAITFSLMFCSLSSLGEKWSAKNYNSSGIKYVKVWIEIKKFVFQRSAVSEFFLPLRGFAETSYCADLLVSVEVRCWRNFEKTVCRVYFNAVEESLIHCSLKPLM